jgi:DNA invertase Pin-like site-specific DNA recombinase
MMPRNTSFAIGIGSTAPFVTRRLRAMGIRDKHTAFNSLDAQREACAAFILSQKHEGWVVLPALYDDGGFSGGTMDRPALQRLLSDIGAGQVDVVVVYKTTG